MDPNFKEILVKKIRKEQSKSLKSGEKLEVVVPKEIEDKILNGYKTILERLSK